MLTCARCKVVWYCNRTCQQGNWRQHKLNCKVYPAALLAVLCVTSCLWFSLLSVLLLIKLSRSPHLMTEVVHENWREWRKYYEEEDG